MSPLKDRVGVGRRNRAHKNLRTKISRTRKISTKRLVRTIYALVVLSLDIQRLIAQNLKLGVVPGTPRRMGNLLGRSTQYNDSSVSRRVFAGCRVSQQ